LLYFLGYIYGEFVAGEIVGNVEKGFVERNRLDYVGISVEYTVDLG
jgi:hypothetical protein